VIEGLARKMWIGAVAGALLLEISGAVAAQQAPNPNGAADTSKPASSGPLSTPTYSSDPANNTFVDSSAQAQQPVSLAEAARLARAKKQAQAKSSGPKAVMIDDDNLSHGGGGISVVGDSSNPSAASGGQAFSGTHSGKLVLLDFWATWCGPCRQSVPDLKRLQSQYGSDQLEVISISADKNEAAWKSFVQQNGMNWEQRLDSDGQMRRQYGVNAFPTFILTDANGHEIQRLVGEDPEDPIANRLAPNLPGPQKGIS
jgi:thiol-disulfide isomerase/thioredoxin